MQTNTYFWYLFVLLFIFPSIYMSGNAKRTEGPQIVVKVGLILNMNSLVGKICNSSLEMAVDEFYSEGNHTKKLVLIPHDSHGNAIAAASAALNLLKNTEVEAIIGPQYSEEAEFIANLGDKTRVPIISFSATSPTVSSKETPYFVRAAQVDYFQVAAVAAIVESQRWKGVVLVCEDSSHGRGSISYFEDAFQERGVKVNHKSLIPPFASQVSLERELYKLMTMQTRVFVVHTGLDLGSKFFKSVQKVGMMDTGYAWIVTSEMGNLLDNLDRIVIQSMQGVLAIQTLVPRSKELNAFKLRWKTMVQENHPEIKNPHMNVYGLWAYDTIRALALAIQTSNAGTSKFQYLNHTWNSSDPFVLGTSPTGPSLLKEIKRSDFSGLSGQFKLVDGELRSENFRIVNIVREEVVDVGSWIPSTGLLNRVGSGSDIGPFVVWPGTTKSAPKGWVVPTNGQKLKILVPVKKGFVEFVRVQVNEPKVSGYSIDIFKAVVENLPYDLSYDFFPYGNITTETDNYDVLIDLIHNKEYDAIVGDVTIRANRSTLVDFTQPYSDSGVSMIVPVKASNRKKPWVFLEPLSTRLWLVSAAFFFFTGTVIWVLEHRINPEFRGLPSEQIGLIFYFAFSTMVFAHAERLASNLARVVVVIWVFVVLILTSSYTANLASILTVEQFQPAETDLKTLIDSGQRIGYQDGSFVRQMLLLMNAKEGQVITLYRELDYAESLTNGSVAAIVDEIPYIKLFLSKYCNGSFVMAGRTYKADGFAFVFQKGSPMVSDVSRAVLNVTQGDQMDRIEKAWLGRSQSSTCSRSDQQQLSSSSLPLYSFRGLFFLTGTVSFGAVIAFFFLFWLDYLRNGERRELSFWRKLQSIFKHSFDDNHALRPGAIKSEREKKKPVRRNSSKVHDESTENDQRSSEEVHGRETVDSSQTDEIVIYHDASSDGNAQNPVRSIELVAEG